MIKTLMEIRKIINSVPEWEELPLSGHEKYLMIYQKLQEIDLKIDKPVYDIEFELIKEQTDEK